MARLRVLRHQQEYLDVTLQEGHTYTLGRKEDCDIVLQPDAGISRTHLTIEKQVGGKWTIKVFSQHIPLVYNGKSYSQLECEENVTQFFITPYQFELSADIAPAEDAPSEDGAHDAPVEGGTSVAPSPYAGMDPSMMSPEGGAEMAGSEAWAPAAPPTPTAPEDLPQELAADHLMNDGSYIGSEEKTSEIDLNGEPYLKFMFSSHSESVRLKGNKWVAGRDSIAQIHLDDKKASRQHFSIEKVGEQYFIKDLKSANGTLLNGQELRPNELREIKSGDIITVNQLTVIFELRDLSFSDKLKDLPLQAYGAPMILTSQEWDLSAPQQIAPPMSTQALAQLPGTAQRVESGSNKLRTLLMITAAVVLVVAVVFSGETKRAPTNTDPQIKTFESLSVEEKRLVRDSYSLAQNLYQEGKIQTAINEIARIHKIVPFYKDSKEMEMRLLEAQETLRQKEFIAQQRQEQEKTKQRVAMLVADCRDRFKQAVDVMGVKNCLSEATQLDPENADATSLVSEVEMRMNQAIDADKKQAEYNESIQRGRELFYKARNLLQAKEYHEAIGAFSTHINSQLPDPDNLKRISQRSISSIEKMISSNKNEHFRKARSAQNGGQLREALLYAEQARQIDPYDYKIANFIEQTRTDLQDKMQNLYTDSVIEERFGNLELSKAKWKEIIEKDIPSGVYYLKAKRKLKQYGL